MTSERQIAANRKNAARSTGPTTAAGKARASRNAWRHGLSRPAARTPEVADDIEALARDVLGGGGASPHERDLAYEAAEGQIEMIRVRRVRQQLFEAVMRQTPGMRGCERDVSIAAIGRLERYERLAETRRNKALAQLV
jgi:hypothetical protein